jgi:hypothetical protein
MVRRVACLAVVVGVLFTLAGCAFSFFGAERRAAWREAEERACMSRQVVMASAYVQPAREISERGACGIDRPLKVSAMEYGSVEIGPAATMNCPMTAATEAWLTESVQPAAIAWFGMPVVSIKQISSYACRPRNNEAGERLSEHAFGNALDVAGFTFLDGRTITVKRDWLGETNARAFLREVFAAACERFKTVLGPGVKYHGDHFHFDLAHHNEAGTSRYCRPKPDGEAPVRGPFSSPQLMSQEQGPFDRTYTGSVGFAGELLSYAPDDVIAREIADSAGIVIMRPGED